MKKFTLSVLFIVSLLIFNSLAVDRSKFKTCQQSGFCKRNREYADGGQFDLVKGSVRVDGNRLVGTVISSRKDYEGKTLVFSLEVLRNGILRMQMDEENKTKERYRVNNILLPQENTKLSYDEAKRTLTWGRNSAVIGDSPFSLTVYEGEEKIISYNERNLMNWEFLGAKEGDHSESFSSHTDSVPNGPSSIGMDVTFFDTDNVYGIPTHATSLSLKPTKGSGITSDPYRLYNLDVFEYELDNPMALYGHIPYLISHNEKRTVGVFWLNAAEMWVDIEKHSRGFFGSSHSTSAHWFSESGVLDLFFIVGPKPTDLFAQYASLTGTQDLPPLFSIAYHQCKWNYRSQKEVEEVDEAFDNVDIPYDVIWLDIEHTDGKRYFTWDNYNFGNPEVMLDHIASKGRKMVTIVDPHIKRDDNYYVHKEASDAGYYVSNKDGGAYEGWCWPGSSSWPDFLRSDVTEWWGSKFQYDNYKHSSNNLFIWNDMNEPSVFSGPEITMQKDVKHGSWEHRDVHNLYGLAVHNATVRGLISRNPSHNTRPFVLSRAFFAGSQRIGAIWTGDNKADWGHLAYSQPMLMTIGLTGLTFSGADVGGFFGDPDAELLTRWYQAGAFQPFFRAHAHLDAKRREPFLYEEPHRSIMKNAIYERYFLLPFWYTCFYQSYKTGIPTMRPLWVEYPQNAKTFAIDDQFMVGDSILVKPVTKAGVASMDVFLPSEDIFYDYSNFRKYSGNTVVKTPLDRIVAFYRGGKIVPRQQRQRRSSTQMKDDPYTLVIALNKDGAASGEIYFDDFVSFDHKDGIYHHRSFTFSKNTLQSTLISGKYRTNNEIERIIIVGVSKAPKSVASSGGSIGFGHDASSKGSIDFEYDAKFQVLTIRKPSLKISDDFVLIIN